MSYYTQFQALTGQVDSRIICSRYIFVLLALWAVNKTPTADCNLSLVINAMCNVHLWSERDPSACAQRYWSERTSLGKPGALPYPIVQHTLSVHSHNLMLCHIRAPQVALVDIGGGHRSGHREQQLSGGLPPAHLPSQALYSR